MHNCNVLSPKWLCMNSPVCSYVRVCVFIYMCVAVDIDAAGLDPEESDPPPHQRSPKANPSTVISPLAREKRMPFFKKVKHLSVTAASRVACRRPNVHASLLHPLTLSLLSLFLCILIVHTLCLFPFLLSSANQRLKLVSRASLRAEACSCSFLLCST